MRTFLLIPVCLICRNLAFGGETNMLDTTGRHRALLDKPTVKLGTVPVVRLERDMTATPDETAQIKQHITNLRKIDHPDFGLSSTMTGNLFAPIASSGHFDAGVLMNHKFKHRMTYKALVAFGPKALPFLLAAFDDDTAPN